MSDYQELKSLTKKELLEELRTAGENMVKKRITVKTRHEKDTSSLKKQKVRIARIKTALKEIDIEEVIQNSKKI